MQKCTVSEFFLGYPVTLNRLRYMLHIREYKKLIVKFVEKDYKLGHFHTSVVWGILILMEFVFFLNFSLPILLVVLPLNTLEVSQKDDNGKTDFCWGTVFPCGHTIPVFHRP